MITNFTISNFKSINNLSLDLSRINLFIGQNRSGKSSVQQAFGLLKQSPEKEIIWNGPVVNLKDFKNILNKQSKENLISIRFGGIDYASAKLETILNIHRIEFGINYDIEQQGILGIDYGIKAGHNILEGRCTHRTINSQAHKIELEGSQTYIRENVSVHFPLSVSGGNTPPNTKPERSDEIRYAIEELLEIFAKHIQNFVFIPVLRGFDKTTYPLRKILSVHL